MKIDFIGVIVPLSILLPFFIALYRWRFLSVQAKYIFWYLLVSVVISFAAVITGKVFHKNNLPLVHLLTALEVVIFLMYYKLLLSPQKKAHLYIYLAVAFILYCIINAIFWQSIYTYSSYTRSVEAIICMLFALNYFAKRASAGTTSAKSINQPDFYFNTGIFLYFSGAFILFIFSNFIITNLSRSDFTIIWNIHGSLVLIMYLLFSTGFLLCKK